MAEKAYYLLLLSCLLSFLQRADIAPPRTHSYRVKPQGKPFLLRVKAAPTARSFQP